MRIIKWTLSLLFSLIILGSIAGTVAYQQFLNELPDINRLRNVKYQQPLSIYSQDNLLIEQFGEKIRTPIKVEKIPVPLINAFTASEDADFYTHSGVDYKGLTRAVIQLILTGKKKQGGSTITMQVARNFLLSNKKTYTRKIKEIMLAFQIEDEFTKNEIIELYLNKIYLGQRAYGIVAAAETYYDRPLSKLTLAELAMIAGLPKAPSRYNPIANPKRAVLRRNYVLGRMLVRQYITQSEFNSAQQAPVTASKYTSKRELYAPYIAEMVRNEIISRYGEDKAYTSGFKVYTTIQSDLQNTAVKALRINLHRYDERHSYHASQEAHQALQATYVIGETYPARVININKTKLDAVLKDGTSLSLLWQDSPWSTKFNPQKQIKQAIHSYLDIISLNDTIRVRKVEQKWRLAQIPEAESAFVALNPNNGEILALSGGYAYFNNKYNRAIQAKRQPGSGFKPIIYTTALEHNYTAASLINDAPIMDINDRQQESQWRPENYSHKFYGPTTLRTGLRKSRNLIAIRLLRDLGLPAVTQTALRFGFKLKQLPQKLSLALGSGYASPLQMARMYAVFANGGFLINSYFIERIESATGDILFQTKPQKACPSCTKIENQLNAPRIISPQINFLMNSLLQDVVQRGTAIKAKTLKRSDLAGKTGTTNQQKDAWFDGFTPKIVGIAWVGRDNFKSLGSWETGGKAALPLWIDFMRYALKDIPEEKPVMPKGISKVLINSQLGLLSTQEGADSYWEYFRNEFIPTQFAVPIKAISPNKDTLTTKEVTPEVLF